MIKVIRELLVTIIANIDAGNSNISDEDAVSIIDTLKRYTNKDREISKYEACEILRIKRAQFDNLVRAGKLPKGHHQIGFKELRWKLKDIETFKKNKNEKI